MLGASRHAFRLCEFAGCFRHGDTAFLFAVMFKRKLDSVGNGQSEFCKLSITERGLPFILSPDALKLCPPFRLSFCWKELTLALPVYPRVCEICCFAVVYYLPNFGPCLFHLLDFWQQIGSKSIFLCVTLP